MSKKIKIKHKGNPKDCKIGNAFDIYQFWLINQLVKGILFSGSHLLMSLRIHLITAKVSEAAT